MVDGIPVITMPTNGWHGHCTTCSVRRTMGGGRNRQNYTTVKWWCSNPTFVYVPQPKSTTRTLVRPRPFNGRNVRRYVRRYVHQERVYRWANTTRIPGAARGCLGNIIISVFYINLHYIHRPRPLGRPVVPHGPSPASPVARQSSPIGPVRRRTVSRYGRRGCATGIRGGRMGRSGPDHGVAVPQGRRGRIVPTGTSWYARNGGPRNGLGRGTMDVGGPVRCVVRIRTRTSTSYRDAPYRGGRRRRARPRRPPTRYRCRGPDVAPMVPR